MVGIKGMKGGPDRLNNFNGKRHELTQADRVKGGGNMTPFRKMVITIKNMKHCNPKCPYYPCFFSKLSTTPEYKGDCALKKQNSGLIRSFYGIILGNESDFTNEMRQALFKIMLKGDEKDLIIFGEKVHRMEFGNKERINTNINVFDELVKELKLTPEE